MLMRFGRRQVPCQTVVFAAFAATNGLIQKFHPLAGGAPCRRVSLRNRLSFTAWLLVGLSILPSIVANFSGALAGPIALDPADMPRVAVVDERFQSYNIEMVEVTGGAFWKPYATPSMGPPQSSLYADRPPIDLKNPRLRRLAAALWPAYLRVSGTWANATYFSDSDGAPPKPPAGFNGVLTRDQWRDVVGFSRAVGARIVTSFAASAGTRDARGRWTPGQARRRLAFTRSIGGDIAAAEFLNEPDLATGTPDGTDPAAFRRDFGAFHAFMRRASPKTLLLGPGTIGEDSRAADMFAAQARGLDAVSYHHYGAVSARCGGDRTPEAALSEQWLAHTDETLAFYRRLRDRLAPGRPIWLTETAEAACGGNRWSATFLDTFRYLDQLGRLAKAGVQVVMHNTLAASDYGLLDERTLLPRPNYFGALLWRRLMGTTVLDSGIPLQNGLHLYAHCGRRGAGAVTLLVINNDRAAPRELMLPKGFERYTLQAAEPGDLQSAAVRLNGTLLVGSDKDVLPSFEGTRTGAGTVSFGPATITFLSIPDAANRNCR
jgi:Glycosyl hydrolase family 79, N-terminal domain